jgi:RNA polymerase sigma factor (sigma-70 family)
VVQPDPDTTDDMLGRVEADQLGSSLTDALGALPVNDRDALLLMAWADLTDAEIAAALHIPLGTVRSRIHRARRQLRAHLETTPDAFTKHPR